MKKQRNNRAAISPRARIGRWVCYALVLALCALPAVILKGMWGWLAFLAVAAALPLSFCYAWWLRRKLTFSASSQVHTCVRGETLEFPLALCNASPLLCPRAEAVFSRSDLFGGLGQLAPLAFTLTPFERRVFPFSVCFDHAGEYTVGLKEICLYDLLGLFPFSLRGAAEYTVQVMPRQWALPAVTLSEQIQMENERAFQTSQVDGSDYTGVREYAFGDPIKNIHWKLSAHANGYLTKLLESSGSTGLAVLLNLTLPTETPDVRMTMLDGLLESALSLALYAREHGMETNLRYLNTEGALEVCVPTGGELPAALIAHPVTSCPDGADSGAYLLEHILRDRYGMNNVAFCTAVLTPEHVSLLRRIKHSGQLPQVFFWLPEHLLDQEREERLRPLRALHELGISVHVYTRPEELGRA
ncbi:MAG: DUF58 domain-containing protein [Oscillospiraceae bacterium]|nr:DUF58 domain-containing protein [Oscillospiraceae bacterium]